MTENGGTYVKFRTVSNYQRAIIKGNLVIDSNYLGYWTVKGAE